MQQAFVLASTLVRVHCNETNAQAFEAKCGQALSVLCH